MLSFLAPYKIGIIIAALIGVISIAGYAILAVRNDIYQAATGKAAATINKEGTDNADRAEAGRLAARACHASGGVWNLAAGKCDGKP
jgi:hypothetical protein